MDVSNVLASLPVNDIEAAEKWYVKVLGRPADTKPMPELAEWRFPRGGCLQVYLGPERAGGGSCTLAVEDLDQVVRVLGEIGVATGDRTEGPSVRTVMVKDPDGNSLAFAEAKTDGFAR